MGSVMFPFVFGPQGGARIGALAFSQADATVVSAILVAIPATIAAIVGAYKAWQNNNQMRTNGGSSMRDAIDRIESTVTDLSTDVRDVKEDVRSIRDDQRSDHARITRLENP
jgi:uncharacterized protein YlxW (UPF0749 family)